MASFDRTMAEKLVPPDSGLGRPLEELLRTNDLLSGMESQRLRTYFSSNMLEPGRDLDAFGRAVMLGDLDTLKETYEELLSERRKLAANEEAARASVMQDFYRKRWGPTRVPIYNLILLSSLINPSARAKHHVIARWLITDVKVPVDGTDLSGSTALHHAISTKPAFEPEYAQLLYDAGGNVNHRNRYGGTPAHEIVMTWELQNRDVVRRAADALRWFLAHGGNIDVKDTDGKAVREMVDHTRGLARRGLQLGTWKVVDDEDRRRKRLADRICAFCGREPKAGASLSVCSACKSNKYCSPVCQRGDWPYHKIRCKKVPEKSVVQKT